MARRLDLSLLDVTGAAYEAATGGTSWTNFCADLCRLTGAQAASLRLTEADGLRRNLLGPASPLETDYLAHYHKIDPYRARVPSHVASGPLGATVALGEELVPRSEFVRTEYYADFARPHGQDHMIGALIDVGETTALGLHRDRAAGAFDEPDRRLLTALIPHLQRALQLRTRMMLDAEATGLRIDALEALPLAVILVDGTMRILHANPAAVRLASGESGLRIVRSAAHSAAHVGRCHLSARHRDDADALKRLVAAAASAGAGGAMRLRAGPHEVAELAALAVLVSPAPTRFVAHEAGLPRPGIAAGAVMIVARDVGRRTLPTAGLVRDLFDLTSAEAAVALALTGAVTAEDVARTRSVSLDTVRSQIRTVLRKTNASGLRDFERIMASLASMQDAPRGATPAETERRRHVPPP